MPRRLFPVRNGCILSPPENVSLLRKQLKKKGGEIMEKFKRSWTIFQKSLDLIMAEKKLLIFPLISAFAMVVLIALIITGLLTLAFLTGDPDASGSSGGSTFLEIVVFFVLYLLTMLVSNLCMAAFFSEIFRGLNGDSVEVTRGIRKAFSRFKAIFLWSLLASTVGLILSMLERRAGILGAIVIKLLGVVWAVASCFAIPAIVCNRDLNNPFHALKYSATAIRRTWGESLIGFVGINMIGGVAVILFFLLVIAGIVLGILANSALCWILVAVMAACLLVALILFSYLVNVAEAIYRAALYQYAEGMEVVVFSEEELAGAFRAKK